MPRSDMIEMEGKVIECLPGATFRVQVDRAIIDPNPIILICKPSGKLSINHIKISMGDRVKVEMSPYDATRGRIIWRYKT